MIVLVQEGPCFLDGPCESASGDAEESSEQVAASDTVPRRGAGRARTSGVKRVVPVTMEAVPAHCQCIDLGVGDLDAGVEFGFDFQTGAGSGRRKAVHDDLMAGQRLPRQFMEMWESSRCSILFHFEVPGGR